MVSSMLDEIHFDLKQADVSGWSWLLNSPSSLAQQAAHLAETVENDQDSSQEVAVGGVIPHNVLVPQLDGNKRPEQLAQLLDDQIKLSLQPHKKHQLVLAAKTQRTELGPRQAVMTVQVTGRPLISFGKHSSWL